MERGLRILGAGFDWGEPYLSCEEWAETFGLSYPIVDDDSTFTLVDLVGVNYVPWNVIIDHNMTIRYSDGFFNETVIAQIIDELLADLDSVSMGTDAGEPLSHLPERPYLYDTYPNPFNSSTTIAYRLPRPSNVRIDVLDLLGRHVDTLESVDNKWAGYHEIRWEPSSSSSGIFVIRLVSDGVVETRKVLLLK